MFNLSNGMQWCYSCNSDIEDKHIQGNCGLALKMAALTKKVRCEGPCITILFLHNNSEDATTSDVKLKRGCYVDYHMQTYHDSQNDSCTEDDVFRLMHPRMFSDLEYRKLILATPDTTISCICHQKDLCNAGISPKDYDLSDLNLPLNSFINNIFEKTIDSESDAEIVSTMQRKYSNKSSSSNPELLSFGEGIRAIKQPNENDSQNSENIMSFGEIIHDIQESIENHSQNSENIIKNQEQTENEHFAIIVNKALPLLGLIIVHHISEVLHPFIVYSSFFLICVCFLIWIYYQRSCFRRNPQRKFKWNNGHKIDKFM